MDFGNLQGRGHLRQFAAALRAHELLCSRELPANGGFGHVLPCATVRGTERVITDHRGQSQVHILVSRVSPRAHVYKRAGDDVCVFGGGGWGL